ncbi:type II secretion system protein [Ferrimonas sp. SCSIO 43195]|uniref:type II secretion system protein n=1 Tax=Ferrimonas sp. SCSIO 43195 TaxID=2822844 RepID=UPI002075FD62|nr:type II secretion system protein [Ferrimonas sp. SCSIO 43195]USD37272.1 type II secretion system protein [Ferrimonas sp. SCSIO 43195]
MIARKHGFTLIEMVVGMVVLAISLVMLSTLMFPQAERAAQGIYQARAAQAGQVVMGELMARQFDSATPSGGGAVAGLNCTKVTPGTDPTQWLFLEDFNGYRGSVDDLLGSSSYDRYRVAIDVGCNTAAVGATAWSGGAKVVTITISAPDGSPYPYQLVRGNY